jgi:phage tail sheath gpL-like
MSLPNLLNLNFLVPFTAYKIDFSRSFRTLRGMPRRVLLVGQKLAVGDAPSMVPMQCATEREMLTRVGEGSMLAAMWRGAKANADLGVPIDILVVPAAGGAVAASVEIVLSLTSGLTLSQAGEVMLYIGGERVSVAASTADTPASVAVKLIAAVNALPALPVTAAAGTTSDSLKLTCKWGGSTGNMIDVRGPHYADDVLPAGLALTIPAMAGGAGVPSLAGFAAATRGYRATEIALAFTDSTNMLAVEAEQEARWLANNMSDGQVITCVRGSLADITTWLASRNSRQVHTIPTRADMTSPWVTASMAAAAIESAAAIDPAVPATGMVLSGYRGPKRADQWDVRDEMAPFLLAGASPMNLLQDGSSELLRMVTNYTQTATGTDDPSTRELCWVKTMSYVRWYVVSEYQTNYRGFKLAEYVDEPIPGQKLMTMDLAEEIQVGCYMKLADAGLVQNLEHYKGSLVIEIDSPNGKLKIQDEPVLIVQHYQTEVTSYPIAGHV